MKGMLDAAGQERMNRVASHLTVIVIFLLTWGLTTHGKYSVTGDEPHYLMIAQSLRADGDLDVANNYARGDGALFGAAGVQPGPHVRQTRAGRTLPVHDIGLAIVLLPVYSAAIEIARLPGDDLLRRMRMNRGLFAYSLISLCLIGLCTTAAAITMRALERHGETPPAAAVIVAIAWLSPPVLSHAFLVFPELVALFVTACVIAAWARREHMWNWRDSAVVLMLGALPWLHRKFALYVIALLAVLVWRRKDDLRNLSRARSAALAPLFVGLPAVLAIWTWHEWGNLAGPFALQGVPLSFAALAEGLPATIVDRENGLIWWAPVCVLLPAGFWLRRTDFWPWLLPIAALIVPGAAHQWFAGFSPAARFLVPLAPIACLFAAEIVRQAPLRVAATALLVPQLILTAYAWQHARLLWPQGDGENRVLAILLPPLGAAYRAIPSFRTAPDTAAVPAALILALIAMLNVGLLVSGRIMNSYAPSRNRRSP